MVITGKNEKTNSHVEIFMSLQEIILLEKISAWEYV